MTATEPVVRSLAFASAEIHGWSWPRDPTVESIRELTRPLLADVINLPDGATALSLQKCIQSLTRQDGVLRKP